MTGPWAQFISKFAGTLARPRRDWSEAETLDVWNSLADGAVSRLLFRYTRWCVGNTADAEDILQGCLAELSIGQSYDPRDGGPEVFRTWVYGCLRHHLGRFFKKNKRELAHRGPSLDSSPETSAPLLADSRDVGLEVETSLDVETMLRTLNPRPREIMERQMRGETIQEIAGAMRLTEVNVRQILFRANHDLRKRFGTSIEEVSGKGQ